MFWSGSQAALGSGPSTLLCQAWEGLRNGRGVPARLPSPVAACRPAGCLSRWCSVPNEADRTKLLGWPPSQLASLAASERPRKDGCSHLHH